VVDYHIHISWEMLTRFLKIYEKYNELCKKQNHVFKTYTHPKRKSTVCQAFGCKRLCGRKGLIFCTEGCDNFCSCARKTKAIRSSVWLSWYRRWKWRVSCSSKGFGGTYVYFIFPFINVVSQVSD
jgi:hypothetical protein